MNKVRIGDYGAPPISWLAAIFLVVAVVVWVPVTLAIIHGSLGSPEDREQKALANEQAYTIMAKNLGVNIELIKGGGHLNASAGFTEFPVLRDSILALL